MKQRKANERIALQNEEEATRLEIERESLLQKEREINEKCKRQREAEAAMLDQRRPFYGACPRGDVEHLVQTTNAHQLLFRIHREDIG